MSEKKPARIPILDAKRIAKTRGYDQIIIIGRKTGDGGCEHVTSYGVTALHCRVAGRIADFLKFKIMGWEDAGR